MNSILAAANIGGPDGRPLHAYKLSPNDQMALNAALRLRIAAGHLQGSTAPLFVLWASEELRTKFEGGTLKWQFLTLPFEGQLQAQDARQLVKDGLPWWKRRVRKFLGGNNMYLSTLLAEGGIPQALLVQPNLYQKTLNGLLSEIEAEGPGVSEETVHDIAMRRVSTLPQTFQTEDFASLLSDLARALINLRNAPPAELVGDERERWLDHHQLGWKESLPIRMSDDVIEQLIRPALRAERTERISVEPIARRQLAFDAVREEWFYALQLSEAGFIPNAVLPHAASLRLRFLLRQGRAGDTSAVAFNGTPVENGWTLQRIGRSGKQTLCSPIDEPCSLLAYADGKLLGETEILSAQPNAQEAPSFWRPAENSTPINTTTLIPLAGLAKSRSEKIFLLSCSLVAPIVDGKGTLERISDSAIGTIWSLDGQGTIEIDGRRYSFETRSEAEESPATMLAHGACLTQWSTNKNGPIYIGTPRFMATRGNGAVSILSEANLRERKGRKLFSRVFDWRAEGNTLVSGQYFIVSREARLELKETSSGNVSLEIEGFPVGMRVRLYTADQSVDISHSGGISSLVLATSGSLSGLVKLRLSMPIEGEALELVAPWPARNGIFLSPNGQRLNSNRQLSVHNLRGWCAILPANQFGDLQFRLEGHAAIAVRVSGEIHLSGYVDLLRTMLAIGGPDAKVNVRLVTNGSQSPRLEVARYEQSATIRNGIYWPGQESAANRRSETALLAPLNSADLAIHVLDLSNPKNILMIYEAVEGSIDLSKTLVDGNGPWLLQGRFAGKIQRACIWPPSDSSRSDRISQYVKEWYWKVDNPMSHLWTSMWELIKSAGEGGDAGTLDQVQALGKVPAAAVMLALRVIDSDLHEVFALEQATYLFWPVMLVEHYVAALAADRQRLNTKYEEMFGAEEGPKLATEALVRRIIRILTFKPELAGHFAAAIQELGLSGLVMQADKERGLLSKLGSQSQPERSLIDQAQAALKRFDRLPSGVPSLDPSCRPASLRFNEYAQPFIDAPLVCAEIACGRRHADSELILTLISLRLADPMYCPSSEHLAHVAA